MALIRANPAKGCRPKRFSGPAALSSLILRSSFSVGWVLLRAQPK